MEKVLSYRSLMELIKQQWELNNRHPRIEIHRDVFVSAFGDISFTFINELLHDLDERYGAIRVTEYAYSKKWEDDKYMDLSAEEIARLKGTEAFGKNIDAINHQTLTTYLVLEPAFHQVMQSFNNPWEESDSTEEEPVETLVLAKLHLRGASLLLDFEGEQTILGTFRSRRSKGYEACRALLNAQGRMLRKSGLIISSEIKTNTTQLPKLLHIPTPIAKIFYSYTPTHCALSPKLELSKRDAAIVRGIVNRKNIKNEKASPLK